MDGLCSCINEVWVLILKTAVYNYYYIVHFIYIYIYIYNYSTVTYYQTLGQLDKAKALLHCSLIMFEVVGL